MTLHPYLAKALGKGSFILLYGEPGVGKTTLSLELAREARRRGLPVCIAATEAGTLLAVRHSDVDARVRVVMSMDDLPPALVECVARNEYVVVDSINALYRLDASLRQASLLAMSSAILRSSAESGIGGVATAQVSLDGSEVPGWHYIAPWATHIARLTREASVTWVHLVKPEARTLAFRIDAGGLRWV